MQTTRVHELVDKGYKDNGLLDRIIFVYPSSQEISDWPIDEDSTASSFEKYSALWEDVINRICEIHFITDENNDYALQNVLNFSPEAGTYFTNWRNGLIHKVNQIKDDGLVDSRVMKIPMIAARLALVFQILRWACGEVHKDFVDIDSIKSAIRLSSYFEDCYSNIQKFMLMESIEPQKKELLDNVSAVFSTADAIQAGLIDENQIDISVKRLLKARFELGEMDENVCWDTIPYSVVDCQAHKDLALKIAQESIVLLQNRNNILPLKKDMKIALMGPNANDSVTHWGNYNGYPSHTETLYEAMKKRLPASQLIYEFGCDRTAFVTLESVFSQCAIDGKPGFKSTYWNNPELEGTPAAVVQNPTPFHFTTLGATVFAPGVNITDFSARYESVFTAKETEDIKFQFSSHGIIRLYIDGQEVASGRRLQNHATLYTLKAEKGKSYDVKFEFIFNSTDRAAQLDFDMGRDVPFNLQASVDKVKDADVIVFAGGISPTLEGEEMPVDAEGFKGGDRTSIELPAIQRKMIAELKKLGKPIIFINYSGSAMGLAPESEICDGMIQAWYPGQAGGTAIADVLFGDYNPAGKLPITFYTHTDQLPDFQDYSMKGRTYRYMTEKPLFCFGHGLSYTTFDYGKARLSKTTFNKGEKLTLTIPITNNGDRNGEEVVQIYLRRSGDADAPSHTLRAFKRVYIPAGETKEVNLTLSDDNFLWFDTATNNMNLVSGDYELLYGGTSDASHLNKIRLTIL